MGLGYPTLRRYDPRHVPGLGDTNSYAALVTGRPDPADHRGFRVLIPYLARPIRSLSIGRIGNWDPTFFALLVVNSAVVAWNALLLLSIAVLTTRQPATGVTASFLYLLSFNVSNLQLVGLVDSIEVWAMLAATWAMLSNRWLLLPLVGFVAAVGKETSIPLLCVFCVSWCVVLYATGKAAKRPFLAVGAMIVSQFVAVVAVQSMVRGRLVGPSDFVIGTRKLEIVAHHPLASLFNHEMGFAFAWLLPLSLFRLGRLPRSWVLSSVAAAITAVIISVWFGAQGNTARPTYSALAPLLLVSCALFIVELARVYGPVSPAK